jgi:hypothetical protein
MYWCFAFYSPDKSAPLVSSDTLAATGFSIVDWVILYTAGQVGLFYRVKSVMERMQRYNETDPAPLKPGELTS